MTTPAASLRCLRWPVVLLGNRLGRPCVLLPSSMKSRPISRRQQMGSFVYAGRCKARGDQISAMISLETIGYFSDAPGSQTYPSPGIGAFYPTTGNFIGFVGNVGSRALLRRALCAVSANRENSPPKVRLCPHCCPGVGWSDQWAFWQHGYPGNHDHRHRALSLSALSRGDRYARTNSTTTASLWSSAAWRK